MLKCEHMKCRDTDSSAGKDVDSSVGEASMQNMIGRAIL